MILNLTVYLLTMTDADDKHMENSILYVADDAVVANTVAPVAAEFCSGQCFAQATRVSLRRNLLVHIVKNAPRCGFVQR